MNAPKHMDKVYLDQLPAIHSALTKFCTELDLDQFGGGADNWISELECRRRDGFIPHGHNHGGFDVYNIKETICGEDEDGSDDSLMLHGFRIMYEGLENGIHTICAYYCEWDENDVYGISKAPTIAEIEIRFRSVNQLIVKLNKFAKGVI